MSANLKVNIKISDNARKIFDEIGVNVEKAEQLQQQFAVKEKNILQQIKKLVGKDIDI